MFLFDKKLLLFLLRQCSFLQQDSMCTETMSGETEKKKKRWIRHHSSSRQYKGMLLKSKTNEKKKKEYLVAR